MKTQQYTIKINASKEKVWNTMLSQDTYREWVGTFSEGGRYEGSWDQGSKIHFLGPDPESGKEGGMFSRIKENRLHEFVSIEHLGMVIDGVEDTTSEEAKKWVSAYENYTFTEEYGITTLTVDIDVAEEYIEMFNEMWAQGLAKIKEIAERP